MNMRKKNKQLCMADTSFNWVSAHKDEHDNQIPTRTGNQPSLGF